MGKKIKIALCLSGQPRFTMTSFPYIHESFLLSHPMYKVDTYIHSWDYFRALKLYNPKKYKIDLINEKVFFENQASVEKLNITSNEVNNILEPFKKLTPNINPLKNLILMYSSIKRCFDLIEEDYDYYIRCRFDLFFKQPLDLPQILLNLIYNSNIDIVLDVKTNQFEEILINDQLAVGNKKSMVTYFNLINNIDSLINETNSIIPEKLLSKHLFNNQINFLPYNFNHLIINNSIIENERSKFKNN